MKILANRARPGAARARGGAALFGAALLGACAPTAATSDALVIGAVVDRSGSNAEPSWGDAIALAERQVNDALKAAGHAELSFHVALSDSRNDPATAVERAVHLVRDQGAKALILDTSQNAVAINVLHYDADPGNDLRVPIQCSGCTSGSINNPTAVNMDPVQQAASRNGQKWLFRTVMSTKLVALIIDRDLLKLGTPEADVNHDGKVKIAVYNGDETFGNSGANDVISVARQLQTDPPVLIEQRKHPSNADVNTYDWAADLEALTNDRNETTNTVDGVPDFIVACTFAQYYIPVIKTWRVSGFDQRVSRMAHFHTFRIQSAGNALGAFGNGQEGVSHVLLDSEESGATFARDYMEAFGRPPRYRDSHYYDNAVSLMLATFRAAHALPDPRAVTGAQVRDALPGLADTGAQVVRTGVAALTEAIRALDRGATVNYEGASGPLDYDANQNIKNRLAHYRLVSGQYVDVARYDCVKASDTATATASRAACPFIAP